MNVFQWIVAMLLVWVIAIFVVPKASAWCQGAYCGPRDPYFSGPRTPYGFGPYIADRYNRCFNCQGPSRPVYVPRNDRYIGRGALWGYPGWRGY